MQSGKSPSSQDIVKFTSVGLSDHIFIDSLQLQDGQIYYLSVKGILL